MLITEIIKNENPLSKTESRYRQSNSYEYINETKEMVSSSTTDYWIDPIFDWVERNDIKKVKKYIKNGGNLAINCIYYNFLWGCSQHQCLTLFFHVNSVEMLEIFLENNINPNIQNQNPEKWGFTNEFNGQTLLFKASDPKMIELLLKFKADPLIKDFYGRDALCCLKNKKIDQEKKNKIKQFLKNAIKESSNVN